MDKDSQRSAAQQTAAEAFVEWFNSQWSDDPGQAERVDEDLYFRDAGEVANMPEPMKPARDSFADWFGPDIFVVVD